nr:unnamed protein product [Callosobruchus chinensis]
MVIGSLGGMRNTLLSALRAIPVCCATAHILAARMQKAVILGLSRRELRKVVGFTTGHWTFSAHLQKLEIDVENPLCRTYGEAVETAKYVIFDCPALCRRRSSYLEVVQEEGRQNSFLLNLQDLQVKVIIPQFEVAIRILPGSETSFVQLLELTGYWMFSAYLQKLGIDVENPLCRKCGEAVETAKHVTSIVLPCAEEEARIWKLSRRREDRLGKIIDMALTPAEKQRRYRAMLKLDAERNAEAKEKHRLRYHAKKKLVYRSRVIGVNVPDARCRACRQAPETLMHLLSAWKTYAGTAYVHRHNAALRVLYYHLRHSYGIDETPVLPYAPGDIESVVENERCRIYWNYSFPTLELVQANKPDIVLLDHQQKTMFVIEFSAPAEVNIVSKEEEKRTKYQELLGQLRRLWPDYAVSLLLMVIGSLGGMRNTLLSALRAIPVCRAAAHILAARMQKAVILGFFHMLRAHDTRTQ